jgi:hypothetical protein
MTLNGNSKYKSPPNSVLKPSFGLRGVNDYSHDENINRKTVAI